MRRDVEIGLVRVQGRDLMAHANVDGGWTLTEPPEEGEETPAYSRSLGQGETLEAAKRSARKRLKEREVKVAVPFKRARLAGSFGQPKELVIEEGVADGLKAGSSTALVTIKGKRDKIDPNYGRGGGIWRADTPDEKIEEHRRLMDESRRIAKQGDEIETQYELDLTRAIRAAIEEEVEISEEQEPEDIVGADEAVR